MSVAPLKKPENKSSLPINPSSKAGRLRSLLTSLETEFIMEAHDGLSAKIVEEAGFDGILGERPDHFGRYINQSGNLRTDCPLLQPFGRNITGEQG